MKPFNKVLIVGVGLLGGSIGLAIKEKKLAKQVYGFFRSKEKIKEAIKIGAIDKGFIDLNLAARECDLIILCSPVQDIINELKKLKKISLPNVLITDAGSTKERIVKNASGLSFIGAHPLAGSEQSGIKNAKKDLLYNAICILTPDKKTNQAKFNTISEFWKKIGMKVTTMSPGDHDKTLAFTSHLPHLTAFSLIKSIPDKYIKYSAGGLKDSTRIALSSPEIWSDIFISNKKHLLRTLKSFEKSIRDIKKAIQTDNKKKLFSLLESSKKKRELIN